jgi:uncharacterized membrane protein
MSHEPVDGFRWRSHEITRVEGFSDAVFGFAVTLLIVSLEVPKTSTDLLETMRGFGSFILTFLILAGIWYAQHTFFRRYGLEDRATVMLNLALLFTVLFFVYPMKFVFSVLFGDPMMKGKVMTAHGLMPVVLPEHKPWIFIIFGFGFIAVYSVFYLLYRHAYRQRERLGLNEFEIWETEHSMRRMTHSVIVGAMYFAVAFMNSLPRKTEGQRYKVEIVSWVVSIAFIAVLLRTMLLFRERRRARKAWQVRSEAPAEAEPK